MPTPYTSPTKASTSILVHFGSLRVNEVDGGVVPAQFALTTDSVASSTPAFTLDNGSPAFTHFDAGVMQAANYDELIIDISPTLVYNNTSGLISVSTTNCALEYQQVQATGRPFWFMIHIDGYAVTALQGNATLAINAALAVLNQVGADVINYQLQGNFKGFAFLRPDLNVVFSDGTAISRTQQNSLVQACWNLYYACCFVTARPFDALTTIAPPFSNNPNSAALLAHPIIGCNPAYNDKIVIVYPVLQTTGQNISVVIGQISATMVPTNRDPGFTPNLSFAYVVSMYNNYWTYDGTGGVTGVSGEEANLANILGFVAAMGITELGLYGVTSTTLGITGNVVPAPELFIPADSAVNTTGQAVTWGRDSNVFVAYANGQGGTTTRQFSANFIETPYTGPVYP